MVVTSDREMAYNRILEILDAYWLSEPDEQHVEVEMEFYKSNGESQFKTIRWDNPKYETHRDGLIHASEVEI